MTHVLNAHGAARRPSILARLCRAIALAWGVR
jgi:hypothetical protein